MAPLHRLEARLQAMVPVILDGANGTEIERVGGRVDHDLWCARAIADHPDQVHEVRRRYIDAGADVIATDSYPATREAKECAALGAHFGALNRPNRAFVERVSLEAHLAAARRWVEAGAAIVGGCRGVGVEHIRTRAAGLPGT